MAPGAPRDSFAYEIERTTPALEPLGCQIRHFVLRAHVGGVRCQRSNACQDLLQPGNVQCLADDDLVLAADRGIAGPYPIEIGAERLSALLGRQMDRFISDLTVLCFTEPGHGPDLEPLLELLDIGKHILPAAALGDGGCRCLHQGVPIEA